MAIRAGFRDRAGARRGLLYTLNPRPPKAQQTSTAGLARRGRLLGGPRTSNDVKQSPPTARSSSWPWWWNWKVAQGQARRLLRAVPGAAAPHRTVTHKYHCLANRATCFLVFFVINRKQGLPKRTDVAKTKNVGLPFLSFGNPRLCRRSGDDPKEAGTPLPPGSRAGRSSAKFARQASKPMEGAAIAPAHRRRMPRRRPLCIFRFPNRHH